MEQGTAEGVQRMRDKKGNKKETKGGKLRKGNGGGKKQCTPQSLLFTNLKRSLICLIIFLKSCFVQIKLSLQCLLAVETLPSPALNSPVWMDPVSPLTWLVYD